MGTGERALCEREVGLFSFFLRDDLCARWPRDWPHHPHARCARSHRPNASSGPRQRCVGRFEGPGLVSAQAQVHFTNSYPVELVIWSSDIYERSVRLNSRDMEDILVWSARATYDENDSGSRSHLSRRPRAVVVDGDRDESSRVRPCRQRTKHRAVASSAPAKRQPPAARVPTDREAVC